MNPGLDESIARAKRGDRDAFEAVYRHAAGRVYALALRLEGHHGDAEDLTQEVFLKVWNALPSFRGDAALGTWIHGIAVRTAIDRYRRDGRFAKLTDASDFQTMTARPAARDLDLEAAIRALPPGMRRFFVLQVVEGYAQHEVAEMAGVAVGTVKSQVFEARRRLRAAMGSAT